jgi:hypothetical protein
MRRLKIALAKKLNDDLAEDMAFHLADLRPEMAELLASIARIEKTGRLGGNDLDRMGYFFCDHWPYHLSLLRRILAKAQKGQKCPTKPQVEQPNRPRRVD